ncbi:MAG: tetratricopeptide repeat protein [Deltaproteobacteria bacterium]|nr:tetratricopeptide repeat protein [Deltaproteobacteria bacterium]
MGVPPPVPTALTDEARAQFAAAAARFLEIRRTGAEWSAEQCTEVAGLFEAISTASPPGIPEAAFDAGVAWQQCNRHKEARRAFERALQLRPDYPAALVQIGIYLVVDGSLDDAAESFRRAWESDVLRSDAYLGTWLVELSRWCGPGNCCPDSWAPGSAGREGEGWPLAQLATEGDSPVTVEAVAAWLVRCSSGGRRSPFRDLVRGFIDAALAAYPTYAPFHNLLGMLAWLDGDVSSARNAFRRAIELDPGSFDALVNFGSLSLGINAFADAEAAYRTATELDPENYDAWIGLGAALAGLGREVDLVASGRTELQRVSELRESAFDAYHRAEHIAPDRPEAYLDGALLLEDRRYYLVDPADYDAVLAEVRRGYQRAIELCGTGDTGDGEPGHAEACATARQALDRLERELHPCDGGAIPAEAALAAANAELERQELQLEQQEEAARQAACPADQGCASAPVPEVAAPAAENVITERHGEPR